MELEQEKGERQGQELNQYLEKRAKENFIESLQNYVEKVKENVNQQEIKLQEYIAIDRIEEEMAVCELSDGTMMDIPKQEFHYDIKEGDIIQVEFYYEKGKQTRLKILGKDEEERVRRLERMKEKMEQIKKNLM